MRLKMILTICIPTLEKRRMLFNRIKNFLQRQIDAGYQNKVMILSQVDDGKMLIGKKRNQMLEKVTTPYVVFVDDDDLVDHLYLDTIVPILENDMPDAVGFKGLIRNVRTNREEVFIHRCGENYEKRGGIYFRPPNHLNPMRTEFYREIPFPELAHGEDYGQCLKLKEKELIKDCSYIDKVMYYYLFNPNK